MRTYAVFRQNVFAPEAARLQAVRGRYAELALFENPTAHELDRVENEMSAIERQLLRETRVLGLIRFCGHQMKGGYGVQNVETGRAAEAA